MRNIFIITCFLVTLTVFSQQENVVSKDSVAVPTSIFAVGSLNYQQNNEVVGPLRLTGYKFLIVDFFNNDFSYNHMNSISIDTRNFGRYASFEDITDNYNKAELNKYDVTRNTNHFIWNTYQNRRIIKQWQKQNEPIKNN
ncbi:hypothetical protein UMM65_01595 [Aureibaculum sp. 2210JD6-5]|uniref:hypothetical protein n=1 Tax=Aureibaculum sp. 2210JD6-5 TaxID=3103957 RepID=UPI002AACF935|nr:hypothetical protein [Aureibaculum sp. 2210JD6-5]MDY7393926.1 hypothetical protein [Aureibaculum sp. 2210JD6-5]